MTDRASIPGCDVVVAIPVYANPLVSIRCIESVIESVSCNQSSVQVLVVDDATPAKEIANFLDGLAAQNAIRLVRNEANLGFVRSANLALSEPGTHDVVLLNSDTEVHGNWIDRLRACSHSHPKVGTVTPFTNNGTICSFPDFCADNAMPVDWTTARLDSLISVVNRGSSLPLPTAVGFCMYVSRDCLDRVGKFDEAAFGRGYGEENDFCMRATASGFLHLLAGDVFVFHKGGASFGSEKDGLCAAAQKILSMRHPQYAQLVSHFVQQDPVKPLRDRVLQAMFAAKSCGLAQ